MDITDDNACLKGVIFKIPLGIANLCKLRYVLQKYKYKVRFIMKRKYTCIRFMTIRLKLIFLSISPQVTDSSKSTAFGNRLSVHEFDYLTLWLVGI